MYELDEEVNCDLDKVKQEIKTAKRQIADADALRRLRGNADFKRVFLTGYLETTPATLVARLSQADKSQREELNIILSGVSQFAAFIRDVTSAGKQAEASLDAQENTLEELRNIESGGDE